MGRMMVAGCRGQQRLARSRPEHAPGGVAFCRGLNRASSQVRAAVYCPHCWRSRFLQVDPIEGGCSNDYSYVKDPINQFDLSGTKCPDWFHNAAKFIGWGGYLRAARLANNARYRDAFWTAVGAGSEDTALWSNRTVQHRLSGIVRRGGKIAAGSAKLLGRAAAWPVAAAATGLDGMCVLASTPRPESMELALGRDLRGRVV
jgi:hypothetical protein